MKKWLFGLAALALMALAAALVLNGVIPLNRLSKADYPIRGVDVSHYQGDVDWDVLAAQDIRFAFVKATEGSSHVDGAFQANWQGIAGTDLRPGAYHFFSFESPGRAQAEHFCRTVPAVDGMLPPVADVEPYGRFRSLKDLEGAADELADWLESVEAAYGMRPVIYTTQRFYREWIGKRFADYDVWIRSVWLPPSPSVRWTFWQYSNRGRLNGYSGPERFIDLNAFRGDAEAFEAYGRG